MAVIALREEASPELESVAARLHWVSVGDLSKALELLHQEGVNKAVMAGQVKHNKIFSSIRPDWKRSEERRVGKESRSRSSPSKYKKVRNRNYRRDTDI